MLRAWLYCFMSSAETVVVPSAIPAQAAKILSVRLLSRKVVACAVESARLRAYSRVSLVVY